MNRQISQEFMDELKLIMQDDFPSLIETFLDESERQFKAVQSHWATQDFESLRRSAHSLKGSSANIGAQILQNDCQELEYSARDGDTASIPALIESVSIRLQEVAEELRENL